MNRNITAIIWGKLNRSKSDLRNDIKNNIIFETIDISLRISIYYFVVGALWILLSDKVLGIMISDESTITMISMLKGWFYVVISSVILHHLVSFYIRKLRNMEKGLACSNLRLSLAGKELDLLKKHYSSLLNDKVVLEQRYHHVLDQQTKLEEFYNVIMDTTHDIIWDETDGRTRYSGRWYELTGYGRDYLDQIGGFESLIHPSDKSNVMSIINEHMENRTPYFSSEHRIMTKNGEYKWFKVRGKFFLDAQGQVYRKIGVYTDITERIEYEQRIHNFTCYDQTTGLKNRVALNETLHSLIFTRNNAGFALLFADIDNFKYINDTMGHTFGDNLLIKVSERLSELCTHEESLFRIGGDEFVILTPIYSKKEEIERRSIDIIRAFKEQFEVNGSRLHISVSIGVSTYPEYGKDADTLLKNADIAVHKAKETGKNRIVFYNEPMNEIIAERMLIEKYLWSALLNNEFQLYYQPQLDLKTNRITGFEALIRWKNSELGMVPPSKFIGIAEETRQIIPIGAWVLRNACEFLKNLHQLGYKELGISVNISMLQLLQDDFVEMVTDTIETYGLNPHQVELEITESILMESYETIAGKLNSLQARGIKMALDDFGKGYSSLNYLKQLPITTLKIDKTFIDTITGNEKNESLTELIVNLGRSMDLDVVAEGVETKEQMEYLRIHQCNKIQGYYYCKPLPEDEIIQKINEQRKVTA